MDTVPQNAFSSVGMQIPTVTYSVNVGVLGAIMAREFQWAMRCRAGCL